MDECEHLREISSINKLQEMINQCTYGFALSCKCKVCNSLGKSIWLCLGDSISICSYCACIDDLPVHRTCDNHSLYFNIELEFLRCEICDTMLDIQSMDNRNLKNLSCFFKNVKPTSIKGLIGLKNLGNTCYMNSVLQVLNQCLPLTTFMTFLRHYKLDMSVPENQLIRYYQVLSENMWNSDIQFIPIEFASCFYSIFTCFEPGKKQDSQEFLRLLFDALHKVLTPFTNIIGNVFSGKLERKIVCHNCGGTLTRFDEFYDLPLSIPADEILENYSERSISLMSEADRIKFERRNQGILSTIKKCVSGQSSSLFDGLVSFFESTEMKEEGNLFYCSPCDGKYFSTLSYSIKELPNILVFTVKRFKYVKRASHKISSHVELPLSIDMRPFCINKDLPYEYELFGVIEHIGSFGRGHYKSYIKNKAFGKWFEMNDIK